MSPFAGQAGTALADCRFSGTAVWGEVPREWQDRNWVPVALFRPNTLWAAPALPTHLKSRVGWLPERSRQSPGEDGGQRSQSDVYKSNRESCKCSESRHGKENEVSDLYGAANHVGQRRQEEHSRRACRRPGHSILCPRGSGLPFPSARGFPARAGATAQIQPPLLIMHLGVVLGLELQETRQQPGSSSFQAV